MRDPMWEVCADRVPILPRLKIAGMQEPSRETVMLAVSAETTVVRSRPVSTREQSAEPAVRLAVSAAKLQESL